MAMKRRQRARTGAAGGAAGTPAGARSPARPTITLEIGEVVLRGIGVGDRHALAAALERELAAALGAGDAMQTLRPSARERVDGGVISLEANHSAPTIGRQIAQVVRRSLIASTPSVGELKISKR
jgi:hypothetical protein